MTEVLFYHLQGQKLEGVLPTLLERSVERGWRVVVQGASDERIDALDSHLWIYSDDSFLPHGTWREAEAADQPVVLTVTDTNPNAATVRFLIDGAPVPRLNSASSFCSTATTTTRWRRRARSGPRSRRRGSMRPTGSRMTAAAG